MLKNIKPDGLPNITEEIRLELHKKYAKAYILYRKHRTYVDCYCTHCMKRYRLYLDGEMITPSDAEENQTARAICHNMRLTCRNCGCQAVAKAEKISRSGLTEYRNICCFLVRENAVYAVCGVLICLYGHKHSIDVMEEKYVGSEWKKFYVMEYVPDGARLFSRSWYGEFMEANKIYEPYLTTGGLYSGYEFFLAENPEVLKDSFLKYVIPRKYNPAENSCGYSGYKPLKFMAYAVKYPAVEMLLKSGAENIVREIIDQNRACKRVINLEGRTAAEVFRTDGNEAAIIRKAIRERNIYLDDLQCWYRIKSLAKRRKSKYKFEDALNICKISDSYQDALKLIEKTGLTPAKYVNYITRLAERYKDCPNLVERTYKDYIEECEQLNYDITDTQICKPADMYAAHSRTSDILRVLREKQAAEAERAKLKEYRKLYKKLREFYEYADGRYTVIVPKSAYEIADEGRSLRHCVGGYAERHITGKAVILFMREVKAPGRSLYTIEMDGKKLVQIRGCRNSSPDKKAMEFVGKWLDWVCLPKSEKHPKAGKTNAA
ncbi:MAG: PcfJ domain-containing protein [Prevotella sp.]|nr:PcfJ domain-containing protein [Prevotella sp.]